MTEVNTGPLASAPEPCHPPEHPGLAEAGAEQQQGQRLLRGPRCCRVPLTPCKHRCDSREPDSCSGNTDNHSGWSVLHRKGAGPHLCCQCDREPHTAPPPETLHSTQLGGLGVGRGCSGGCHCQSRHPGCCLQGLSCATTFQKSP